MQELKDLTTEQKQAIVDEVNREETKVNSRPTTEVVSIKTEEERTGKKIEVPDAERLLNIVSAEFFKSRQAACNYMYNMSKKQIIRAVTAFLDLPTSEIPVDLKDPKEVQLFHIGQKVIQCRFTITQYHIQKLMQEERLKQQQLAEAKANGSSEEQQQEVVETAGT